MRDVLLGLGANSPGRWGSPAQTLRLSLIRLAQSGVHPVGVSRLYRTRPVGGPKQASFLNAVVLAQTSLAPGSLLRILKHLERTADQRIVVEQCYRASLGRAVDRQCPQRQRPMLAAVQTMRLKVSKPGRGLRSKIVAGSP